MYGITVEEYDGISSMADGECVICGSNNNGNTLCLDHNHDTNVVRDMLCTQCNTAIGMFGEDVNRIKAAIDYLEYHND